MDNRRVKHAALALVAVASGYLALASGGPSVRKINADSTNSTKQEPTAAPKKAGEQFKNIQVLKDIPASQLFETMRFFTASLGVNCNFCHVNPWEKDDKAEKQTARKMIKMMQAINAENFSGETEVTCATCHQGHSHPSSAPPISGVAQPVPVLSAKTETNPTVDQVFEKYVAAIGGQAALDKNTSRVTKASVDMMGGKADVEVYQKPGKYLEIVNSSRGTMTTSLQGDKGWSKGGGPGGGIRDLNGPELARAERDGAFYLALDFKSRYPSSRVGKAKLGDTEVIVVSGRAPNIGFERLYFDPNTGLLLRIDTLTTTPLGPLPDTLELSDFRDVDGVKLPFVIKESNAAFSVVEHVSEIKNNVPIDDSKFEQPAGN